MNFADDYNFILLWLTPLLIYIFWRAHKSLQKRLQNFATSGIITHLYQSRKMLTRYTLLLLAFVCIVLALARPQFNFEWAEVKTKNKDLYIIVDVSQSMLADDIAPNRLERAKRKLTDLLAMLTGERVSLIAFAGASFVQCPLTRDYSAAKLFLEHLHPDLIPVAGTAIGEALALALDSIEKNASPIGSAIILLTDGEDDGSEPLKQVARATEAGIKIYPIGIGSIKGVPIPDKQGNYIKDDNGNLILSHLDEQTLQRMALDTGGTYVRSVHGDFDLEQVYTQGIKSIQADVTATGDKKKIWREHYYLPLLLALLALLGEFALAVPRLGLFLLIFLMTENSPAIGSDAHDAFQNKNYGEAAELFRQQEDRDNLQATYNRAVSEYFDKNYPSAAEGFARAARSKDSELANKAKFNLGNALAAQGKFAEAIKSYTQVLQEQPDDVKAKDNLAWAKKMLKQQEQKQDQEQTQEQEQAQRQEQNQEREPGQEQQKDQKQGQQQKQNQEQEQAQGQEQKHEQAQEHRHLQKHEAEKLLRRLGDKIGIKPRLKAKSKESKQKW